MATFRKTALFAVLALACLSSPAMARSEAPGPDVALGARQCAAWMTGRTSESPAAVHRTAGGALCLDGQIDETLAAALVEALDRLEAGAPTLLVVRSGGGGIGPSLDIAAALVPRKATVVVDTLCGSGCANYIFLAGQRRIILQDGVVVFHGGATPALLTIMSAAVDDAVAANPKLDGPGMKARFEADLERDLARQSSMLAVRGIDPSFFAWFDQVNVGATALSPDCAQQGSAKSIVFSQAFLRARGVTIDINQGPDSAEGLRRLMARRGWDGFACFWD